MAMASSLLLLLLLLPPLVSAGVPLGGIGRPRPSSNTGNFFGRAIRKALKDTAKDYLKDQAQQTITGIFSPRQNNNNAGDQHHELGSTAADTAPALIFSLSIGTQQITLPVIMDITSELVWALCSCNDDENSCLRTPETPVFQPPAGTSSFSVVGCTGSVCQDTISQTCAAATDTCEYVQSYVSSDTEKTQTSTGYLATETFTFGTTPVANVVFGCSGISTVDLAGASGSVGFNRGPLSIVSQLQLSSFSYLISSDDDPSSSKSFVAWSWEKGVPAVQPSSRSRSTPLLAPETTPIHYLYYVKLTGVEVDGQLLQIEAGTFDVQVDSSGMPQSGGVILSTTQPVTYLEKNAYDALRAELVSRISAQGVNPMKSDLGHLCYLTSDFSSKEVPTVKLVFDGHDAKMELDVKNYFFSFPPDSSGGGQEQECLTILPSIGGSILGSLLQMDMNMTIDVDRGLLTFDKAAKATGTAAASAVFPVPLLTVTAAPLLLLVCQMLFF